MLITGYVWLIVHVFYIKKIYKIPTKDRGLEIEMIHVSNNDNSCDITMIFECMTNLVRGISQVGYLTRLITASPVNDFDHLISLLKCNSNNDNLSCC